MRTAVTPTVAPCRATSAGRGGIASGVFNTSRQVGGALAVAVFGMLLSSAAFPAGELAHLVAA